MSELSVKGETKFDSELVEERRLLQPFDQGKCLLDRGIPHYAQWKYGNKLPFADAENKALQEKLEEKQRTILQFQEVRRDEEHVENLKRHQKRAQENLVITHNLIAAKKSELESSENYCALSEKINKSLKIDAAKAKDEAQRLKHRNEGKNEYIKGKRKAIKEIEILLRTNRTASERLEILTTERQSEMELVSKYMGTDEKQINDLQAKVVELGGKNAQLRNTLDSGVISTEKNQEHFKRLSADFKKSYKQRQEMMKTWEDAILVLKRKEIEMCKLLEELSDVKNKETEFSSSLEVQKNQLSKFAQERAENEHFIKIYENNIAIIKDKIIREEKFHMYLKDHNVNSRSQISQISAQMRIANADIVKLENENMGMVQKIERIDDMVQRLKEQKEDLESKSKDADARETAMNVAHFLKIEAKKAVEAEKELEKKRSLMWDKSSEKIDLEKKVKLSNTDVDRTKVILKGLIHKEVQNLSTMALERGKLYRLDLDLNKAQSKYHRLNKVHEVDPDSDEISPQQKMSVIKEVIVQLIEDEKLVNKELQVVNKSVLKQENEIREEKKQKNYMKINLHNLFIGVNSIKKLMAKLKTDINDLIVENNVKAVSLRRINDQIRAKKERICAGSQARLSIEATVRRRKEEIILAKNLTLARIKSLKDENSQLSLNLANISMLSNKLRGRFELLSRLLLGPGGDVHKIHHEYLNKIQGLAREKETLLAEKKTWERKIREAERELIGLENVGGILKCSNDTFKTSLIPPGGKSAEKESIKELEEEWRLCILNKNIAKKRAKEMKEKLECVNEKLAVIIQELKQESEIVNIKKREYSRMQNVVKIQHEKINKWDKSAEKVINHIKKFLSRKQMILIEADLKGRFIMEKYRRSIEKLTELVNQNPEIDPIVNTFLSRKGLLKELRGPKAYESKIFDSSDYLLDINEDEEEFDDISERYGEDREEEDSREEMISRLNQMERYYDSSVGGEDEDFPNINIDTDE